MAVRSRRVLLRAAVLIFATVGLFGTSCVYHNALSVSYDGGRDDAIPESPSEARDFQSLLMGEDLCRTTFPGLFKEIDDSVARGPFPLKKAPDDYTGLIQGQVKDGKLYIISTARDVAEEKIWWRSSTLHSLHRALVTSPEPLPDTHFSLVINDSPRAGSWSFSRSYSFDASPPNTWLMPHFSGWSWPLPFIRSMDEALAAIDRIEEKFEGEGRWEKKTNMVLWRGTSWFNGIGIPDLRPKLLEATKGKEWADVEALDWVGGTGVGTARNAKRIEDFCRYRYIAYTEGVTYSGRLPLHQACASVILTPPITHLQHTSHFIRPLFSSSLALSSNPHSKSWIPSRTANFTWPTHYSPSEANIIFVAPDWSDLEAVISYLRQNPTLAEGIARRQRELYIGGGYLSTAAEVCYWRGLLRGWSEVARLRQGAGEKGAWKKDLGMRWETFALTGKTRWDEDKK